MQAELTVGSNYDFAELWQYGQKEYSIEKIIDKLCGYFVGTPYELLKDPIFNTKTLEQLLACLAYEDEPKVHTAGFDCVTFVETVLALVLSMHCRNLQSFTDVFRTNLQSLRYYNGLPNFLRRNYFFSCVDWIPNNQWLVKDISHEICSNISYAKTTINKLSWLYQYRLLEPYRAKLTLSDLAESLARIGFRLTAQESVLPYIESKELLNNFNIYVPRFPLFSIVFIVRPDWDVKEVSENYGTHLNISHLGICLKKQNELYFYHANSINTRVVKVEKLDDYLIKYLDSRTVKGIHVVKCKF